MADKKPNATATPNTTKNATGTPAKSHEAPHEAPHESPHETSGEQSYEGPPVGAIAVTTFLTVVILCLWFGMYFLNIARG